MAVTVSGILRFSLFGGGSKNRYILERYNGHTTYQKIRVDKGRIFEKA